MDKMPIIALLLHSFPESVIIVSLGIALLAEKISLPRVIIIGLLSAVICFFIREIPLPYGFHTVSGVLILTILIYSIHRIRFKVAFAAAMIAITSLITSQLIITSLTLYVTGLTVSEVLKNSFLRVIIPIPELLFLAMVTYIVIKYRLTLIKKKPYHDKFYFLEENANG
ncbi:MAG: hypothetical protein ACOY35_09975 [Bacillota bacterium]|nr:hypothetical protein [Bacillota bacterium]